MHQSFLKILSSIEIFYVCADGQPEKTIHKWTPSSEFVSSSIPSWQILTAHAQPFRGATDLAFCLKVTLDSLLVWASSGGSGETARMRRLAWTFAARIGDKYQIRLMRSKLYAGYKHIYQSRFIESNHETAMVSNGNKQNHHPESVLFVHTNTKGLGKAVYATNRWYGATVLYSAKENGQ